MSNKSLEAFLKDIDGENKPQVYLDAEDAIDAVYNSNKTNKDDRYSVKQAILDGIEDYKRMHGVEPSVEVVTSAVRQGKFYLDDILSGEPSANSQASNSRALVPRDAIISIRAAIMSSIPFAHYLPADTRGEAKFILVTHSSGNKCGMYKADTLLDGLAGGDVFIRSDRTHKMESSDQATYTGKITPIMTSLDTCDQAAQPHPLYSARSELIVNGIVVATSQMSTSEKDNFSGVFSLHDKEISITSATINIKTGEATVTFNPALEANDEVKVRGYLNVEANSANYSSPEIKTDTFTRSLWATPYRAKVVVTPEALSQFQNEIGVDPKFEGIMVARSLLSQENLYKALSDGCEIGKHNGLSATFDYNWSEAGKNKSTAEITAELLAMIGKISQDMANTNGSHGVSHIYVDEKVRAILLALDPKYFVPSGIEDRAGAYRLGRLAGKYEVYYTPKGLRTGTNMLLIGANASNSAFNPVIIGDATPPQIQPANPTVDSPNSGSWLLGKAFLSQNPYSDYAKSYASITVTNTALG